MNPESSTEASIKALQAQNAQFQKLIMGLAQGQEELKALLVKQNKKKKRTVLFNTGRRLGNTLRNEAERTTPSVGEGSHQERERGINVRRSHPRDNSLKSTHHWIKRYSKC